MKVIIAVLCVLTMMTNAYVYVSETEPEWVDPDGGGGDGGDVSSDLKVNVPDHKLHDIAPYDYSVFMQFFWKNKSSEEFYKYTISISGQWIRVIKNTQQIMDGFGDTHRVVWYTDDMNSHFTITIEQNDSEPISASGEIDVLKGDSYDLNYRSKILKQTINASLKLTSLPSLPDLPIGSEGLKYDANVITYLDPNYERSSNMADDIFGGEKTLGVGDSGQIDKTVGDDDWESQVYNWTVDKAIMQSGYETLLVNITAPLIEGWLPFQQNLWISNDVSFPVKEYSWINSSYEDENETFWFITESEKTLQDKAFQRGDADIPWGSCPAANHFRNTHKLSQFSSWKNDWVPENGNLDDTSFKYGMRDAVDFALDNSDGLQEFLDEYDDGNRVMVYDCWYNETKDTQQELDPQRRAGKFTWNCYFAYCPTEEEMEVAYDNYYDNDTWEPRWVYWVAVSREVNKTGTLYNEDIYLSRNERPEWNGSRGWRTKDQFPGLMLTLSTSEDIIRSYPEAEAALILDPLTNDIKWEEDDYYDFNILDLGTDDTLTTMLNSITGISFPRTRTAYTIQQGSVWEDGQTVSISVDAETGRMVYYGEASGTPLQALFASMGD
jgi:hypothetical protein